MPAEFDIPDVLNNLHIWLKFPPALSHPSEYPILMFQYLIHLKLCNLYSGA